MFKVDRDFKLLCFHIFLHSHTIEITCLSSVLHLTGFSGSLKRKESACNVEDQVQTVGLDDSLEKEMATHSSILAWKIPRTEEPQGHKELDTIE